MCWAGVAYRVPFPKTASMMGVSPPRFLGLSGNQLTWCVICVSLHTAILQTQNRSKPQNVHDEMCLPNILSPVSAGH